MLKYLPSGCFTNSGRFRMSPYIGITGIMSRAEAKALLAVLSENEMWQMDKDRMLMLGYLASSKSLQGLPTRYPKRYPKIEDIPSLIIEEARVLNLIHYHSSERDEKLYDEMLRIGEMCRINEGFSGFQLNVAWPSPMILERWQREADVGPVIVLQVGGRAMEEVNHSPSQLAQRVKEYEGVVDYVLIDPSGGKGQDINPAKINVYLHALKEAGIRFGMGVAGGLSGDSLNLLMPILSEFPQISIDAEGKLRDAEGNLSLDRCVHYLNEALRVLNIQYAG